MIWGISYEQRQLRETARERRAQSWNESYQQGQKMLESIGKHQWFAWRPVALEDGRWAWLESVNRWRTQSVWDRHWLWRYEARP